MKKFNGYEETQAFTDRERLPKGAYVLKVLNVSEVTYSWGSVLKFDVDVAEGEYKDFYKKDYDSQTQEDKKWKGSLRLSIPKDDGSEKDGWTKGRFKTAMNDFEQSNAGYRWDWDETKLIGKLIGGLFNNKEWEMGDKTGWFTQCKRFITVENVRTEKYKLPDDEALKNRQSEPKADTSFIGVANGVDEEIPFY